MSWSSNILPSNFLYDRFFAWTSKLGEILNLWTEIDLQSASIREYVHFGWLLPKGLGILLMSSASGWMEHI